MEEKKKEEEEQEVTETTKIPRIFSKNKMNVALRKQSNNTYFVSVETNEIHTRREIAPFDYYGLQTQEDFMNLEEHMLPGNSLNSKQQRVYAKDYFLRMNPNGGACACASTDKPLEALLNTYTRLAFSRRYVIVKLSNFKAFFKNCDDDFIDAHFPMMLLKLFFTSKQDPGDNNDFMNNISRRKPSKRHNIQVLKSVFEYIFQEDNSQLDINYVLLMLTYDDDEHYTVSFPWGNRYLGETSEACAIRAFTRTTHPPMYQEPERCKPFSLEKTRHTMPGFVDVELLIRIFLFKLL